MGLLTPVLTNLESSARCFYSKYGISVEVKKKSGIHNSKVKWQKLVFYSASDSMVPHSMSIDD